MEKRSETRTRFLRGIAALVFAVLLLGASVLAFAPGAQAASLDYGSLSRKYETDGDPTDADPAWGYGAYQMLLDTAIDYSTWLSKKSNATYKSWGEGLLAAHEADSSNSNVYFNAMWRYVAGTELAKLGSADQKRVKKVLESVEVSAGSKSKALKLQYSYALKAYYKPAVKYWKKVAPKFDDENFTVALRSVLFSCAIANGPYGSAYNIFEPALEAIGGWKSSLSEKKLIKAIYAERAKVVTYKSLKKAHPNAKIVKIASADATGSKFKSLVGKCLKHYYSSSSATQVAVYNRFKYKEQADALALLATCKSCTHAKTTGGKVTAYSAITDLNHKEKRTAVVCTTCGKTLAKAGTYTVKNVYVMKGASYRDASGRDYTVHAKGSYLVGSQGADLHKSAKSTSKTLASAKSGAVVKVTKAKLASDGFWWGKTKVSKKTGWVRMDALGAIGTASAHSYDKKGVCAYCGVTKTVAKRMAKIAKAVKTGSRSCTLVSAGSSYKAAYAVKSKLSKTYAKGAKVTVTKVVENVYGDWWGKLSEGGYIDLTLLK